MSREHTVRVWDRPCVVSVYRKSQTVWIAVGDYMGRRIEVKNRSERSAVALWKKTATFWGN